MLRDANVTPGICSYLTYNISGSGVDSCVKCAVSASFTQKLDTKFDDGMPYSGAILGTLTKQDWNFGNNINISGNCNTLKEGTFAMVGATAQWQGAFDPSVISYLPSNDISKGCLPVFLVQSFD